MTITNEEIAERFSKLLVNSEQDFGSYFGEISSKVRVDDANFTTFSCHMVRKDANGNDRVREISKMLAGKVIEYAIPKSKIQKAEEHRRKTNSLEKYVELHKEASNLFTSIKNSGECGEVLLYAFSNSILKLPQVLCKMPFKTNSEVHYHGVDGLHAKYDESNKQLLLFWGESKVYGDVSSAMGDCFKSLGKMLLGTSQKRDLELFRDNIDLDDKQLESLVLSFLDPDNENNLALKHCGICLIGYDEDAYSKVTEKDVKGILLSKLLKRQESIKYYLTKENLNMFEIHVFLVPFPSAEKFRLSFLEEIGK